MTEETYQGWANYPTWACYAWLTHDEHAHRYWQDRSGVIRDDLQDYNASVHTLAYALRDEIGEEFDDTLPEDSLEHDGGNIDFFEIAKAFLAELN